MLYAAAAVERAMKVQEVICRVLAGTLTWLQGADILGIHTRSLRRWRARYERDGVLGLHDGRRGQPSRRKAPVAEVQRILRLYRERYGPRDGHPGFNVRHFYHLARRDHGVTLSYTFVRLALHEAGLVRKGRTRGRHRRRRDQGRFRPGDWRGRCQRRLGRRRRSDLYCGSRSGRAGPRLRCADPGLLDRVGGPC